MQFNIGDAVQSFIWANRAGIKFLSRSLRLSICVLKLILYTSNKRRDVKERERGRRKVTHKRERERTSELESKELKRDMIGANVKTRL